MTNWIRKNVMKLLWIPAILVIGPMWLYQCQVNTIDGKLLDFTHSSEIWGHFGDFMNVWVSMASLIVLGFLTYYIHDIEVRREEEIERERKQPKIVRR